MGMRMPQMASSTISSRWAASPRRMIVWCPTAYPRRAAGSRRKARTTRMPPNVSLTSASTAVRSCWARR